MELYFHPDSIRKIAEIAIEKKTGARGLRRIIDSLLNDALFEYSGTQVRYVVVDANLKIQTFEKHECIDAMQYVGKNRIEQ